MVLAPRVRGGRHDGRRHRRQGPDAALLESAGIEAERSLENARPSIAALPGFLPTIAHEVDRREHAVECGALKHHLPSVDDLVRESRAFSWRLGGEVKPRPEGSGRDRRQRKPAANVRLR
ncbi:hypothetical protein [Actinomadura sp. NBRC 104412]|uniref:imine reductase family protein n=1 Tax=Actinomadura sp. NBRC 104412 TaxID=3032203 RepID=UPI00331CAEA6